ncbi:MAG: Lar family restriction alleviation protein [Clostridia bacterium]|nr:Lar family restriction alleviation protein [Clostridia bacterium]
MDHNELKPCPFCGFEHPIVEHSLLTDVYSVSCPKCQTKFRNDCSGVRDNSIEKTITAWNTRAPQK